MSSLFITVKYPPCSTLTPATKWSSGLTGIGYTKAKKKAKAATPATPAVQFEFLPPSASNWKLVIES